jgi:hypothetical protein
MNKKYGIHIYYSCPIGLIDYGGPTNILNNLGNLFYFIHPCQIYLRPEKVGGGLAWVSANKINRNMKKYV